jgi:Putative auto-transporter adhesin, head GIN domain
MTVAPTAAGGGHSLRRGGLVLVAALLLLAAGIGIGLLIDPHTGAPSQTKGSGVPATQTRTVAPFNSVELAGTNRVTIEAGAKQSVVVHADDNLLDRITTSVRNRTLVVGNAPGSVDTTSPTFVHVTVPALEALTLSGSGMIDLAGIAAPSLAVKLPGSGVVHANGTASSLDVDLSGSGDAQLQELVAGDVHAIVGGSGRILVNATKSLDASVSGSGAIVYVGSPAHVTKNIAGTGAIVGG